MAVTMPATMAAAPVASTISAASSSTSRSQGKPSVHAVGGLRGDRRGLGGFFHAGLSAARKTDEGVLRVDMPAVTRSSEKQSRMVTQAVQAAPAPVTSEKVNPRSIVAVILGGGAGTRLYPLTRMRAKPAVPIGGAYRLIDIPMSNCINSGINKIYILTQFNSTSLNRHLSRTYNFGNGIRMGGDGFTEVLAATQTPGEGGKDWFQGTADAVRQYLWLFEDVKNKDVENVVILSGDHLYRMDYLAFVQKHVDTKADITIAALPMDESRASDFGLMKIDRTGRIIDFAEKPKGNDLLNMRVDTTVLGLNPSDAAAKPYIASMGIYVFRKDILLKLLRWRYPTANDFGSEIIPASAAEFQVKAYLFDDYWEDIGTIKSFFDANLALTQQPPQFKFYDADKPIYTSPRFLPPTKVKNCEIKDSIISHGCTLSDSKVTHSIIGIRAQIDKGVTIKDVLHLGADFYETEGEKQALRAAGKVPVGVGENTTLQNCIIDKNARIGKNCVLVNKDNINESKDFENLGILIRSGIVVVMRNATVPDGTVL